MARIRLDPTSRMPLPDVLTTPRPSRGHAVPVVPMSDPPPRAAPLVPSRYVELTLRTNFSFLDGASRPEEMLLRARALDYDAIAVTDKDGLYGIVRAHEEAIVQGVRLIVGCELTFSRDGVTKPFSTVTVHVENHAGYTNLCCILTKSHALHPKGKPRDRDRLLAKNCFAGVPLDFIAEHATGLWVLAPERTVAASLGILKDAFGERMSLSVHKHLVGDDRARLASAVRASSRFGMPICVTNDVRFASRENKPVYDVLHCIREGVTLDHAGRALLPNAEAHLKSEAEMLRLFAGHDDWIARSRTIADACVFKMTELRYHFPSETEFPEEERGEERTRRHEDAKAAETPDEALRRLTYEGARGRYGEPLPEKVTAQIEKELALIAEIEVAPYFLSVRSIVKIARARDILCQGRGSAANSAVCYCLGITAVDPTRSNMLFERFLSAERREPPDIDVDFEHERREEVIQEIYRRFGRERAAMVSEVICYRGKSALREVGKVFGLSLEQVERLSAIVNWWDGVDTVDAARLRDAGFDGDDARVRMVLRYAGAIQGFPRHLSIHVGGFVLSSESLTAVAPIEPATMKDRTIIPWDKDDIDTLGFFKVDVLGLGMLTAIRKALDLIHGPTTPEPLSGGAVATTAIDRLAKIPAEDPDVYEALCHADTVGVFQIESRAQMSMLPRLKPRTFYDLVVEVAIVRPGPIQGGMIHPYLRRRQGLEDSKAPHPCLEPILERTLGVPLFQEQVMQIAIVGAGYSGGEADRLRRDMAAWKKTGRLAQHKERLYAGFAARGISAEFAEKLYAQIQGFGEYGFPESHAASFALLVYASAWIKVHHPAAFAAALVNSQPMGFYSASTLLQDAEKHGVELRGIDVTKSDWDCTLDGTFAALPRRGQNVDGTPSIRIGLRQVRGLGEESGRRIEKARRERAFAGVPDLATRAELKKDELEALAEAGALAALMSLMDASVPQAHSSASQARGSVPRARASVPRALASGDRAQPPTQATTTSSSTRAGAGGLRATATEVCFEVGSPLADARGTEVLVDATEVLGDTTRRAAMWKVRAPSGPGKGEKAEQPWLFAGMELETELPLLPELTRAEALALDYARTGLSVHDHPMRIVRPRLDPTIKNAIEVQALAHETRVSSAGLVICRQRPMTASGVVFITMEDETGFINLILYAHVFERLHHVATTASLLMAHGRIEREGEVVYIVVGNLSRLELENGVETPSMSRDFH